MRFSSEKSSQRGKRVLPGSQMVYFVKGIFGEFGMVESAHWTVSLKVHTGLVQRYVHWLDSLIGRNGIIDFKNDWSSIA